MRSLLACLMLVGQAAASADTPNMVLILIDDMGWGDLSCFGNRAAKTPNLDQVAAEGLRFTQFYVNSPICSPSRCALMTGQYPERWRITSYLNNRASNENRGVANWLDLKAPTLPRLLRKKGYATGHFGKWHLGGQRDVDDAPPIPAYGFDESLTNFEGMGPKLLPLTLKPGETREGRIWQDAERLGGPVRWVQRSKITSGFAEAALQFIDAAQRQNKPFYVNLWPDDVHSPWWPPVDKWGQTSVEMYHAVLEEMDRQLGGILERLRADVALRDNTLLLILSDNGPEPGAGSAGPFRGAKTTLYEGGIRSPLIVWGPGLINREKAGTTNETSVFAAFDLAPSLLAIAGLPPAEDVEFDGEDLSEVILGRGGVSRREPIFWRRPPDRKNWPPRIREPQPDLAMREGRWKLLCDYDGSGIRLYDLSADPGESRNAAADNPDLAKRMAQAAVAWHQSLPQDKGPEISASQ